MNVHLARGAAERLVDQMNIAVAPVDVVAVASALGLQILREDLEDDVSGLLISKSSSATIVVRKHDAPVRRRFTIAHEIGHFVLQHHLQRNELVHTDDQEQVIYRSPRAYPGMDPIEVQANQFAAALLMPTRLIRHHLAQTPRPLSEQVVNDLSLRFEVSAQAMTIRLTGMGLI